MSQLEAILKLLDDPDYLVYQQIKPELMLAGESVLPALEHAWEMYYSDDIIKKRIEHLMEEIHFNALKAEFSQWIKHPSPDVFTGLYLLSKWHNPDITKTTLEKQVDKIVQMIWLEFNDQLTGMEKIATMNKLLFSMLSFTQTHSHNNDSLFFLPTLLSEKTGTASATTLFYLMLAQKLQLPVFGTNTPHLWALTYTHYEQLETTSLTQAYMPLFYILPSQQGKLISLAELHHIAQKKENTLPTNHPLPCSTASIFLRYIDELDQCYMLLQNSYKASQLSELKDCLISMR